MKIGRLMLIYFFLSAMSMVWVLAQDGVPTLQANRRSANAWQATPKPLPPDATDSAGNDVLNARGEFFDKSIGADRPLDEPNQPTRGFASDSVPREEFPITASDAIVVATFKDFQPYLSPSHRSIYTAIVLQIEQVLKSGSSGLVGGREVTVLKPGGTVQLADGRTISHAIIPSNFSLRPGKRYVLFLDFNKSGDFYLAVKSWELAHGVALPNSEEDDQLFRAGNSRYAGLSEQRFVDVLKREIQARKSGSSPTS
jgi:hypothetical protein